jgi:hypothetical protein
VHFICVCTCAHPCPNLEFYNTEGTPGDFLVNEHSLPLGIRQSGNEVRHGAHACMLWREGAGVSECADGFTLRVCVCVCVCVCLLCDAHCRWMMSSCHRGPLLLVRISFCLCVSQ